MTAYRGPMPPRNYLPHTQVTAPISPYNGSIPSQLPSPAYYYSAIPYAPVFQPKKGLRLAAATLIGIGTLWIPTIVVIPMALYALTGLVAVPIIVTIISFCYALALIPTIVNLPYPWSTENLGPAFKLLSYRAWKVFYIGFLILLTFGIALFFIQAASMFSGRR